MKYIVIMGFMLFLIGCGGGGGVSEEILPVGTEKMVYEQLYTVSAGDQVIKTSMKAQIRVTHVSGEVNSTIELIEGAVNIVRKQ